jgi:hypothetical protein
MPAPKGGMREVTLVLEADGSAVITTVVAAADGLAVFSNTAICATSSSSWSPKNHATGTS